MVTFHNLQFSAESAFLERSVMRELIKRTAQPGMIALSGGLPASEFLPTDALRDCVDAVLTREGGNALQYRPMYQPLLEWIAEYMGTRGVTCDPDQVFITNGNQQALTILSHLFLDQNALAVTEAITFTGIHQVTRGRGIPVRTVATDLHTGVDLEALERAFRINPTPRLAIIIPDFHNPLGVSITEEKRIQIAQLAEQYGVFIVEDDPYSPLRFTGKPLPAIKAYDTAERVFYLGSFSKMLMPAARLGWMIAPRELIPKLTVIRESIDLESSGFMQRIVAEFLQRHLLYDHLKQLNTANAFRCAAMLTALDQYMGDIATWTHPEGGLFVWLTLNDAQIDTWQLFEHALKQRVAFVPGGAFAVEGGYHNTLRLNFSNVNEEQIEEGIKRLAAVVREYGQQSYRKNGNGNKYD